MDLEDATDLPDIVYAAAMASRKFLNIATQSDLERTACNFKDRAYLQVGIDAKIARWIASRISLGNPSENNRVTPANVHQSRAPSDIVKNGPESPWYNPRGLATIT
jgi:hypothetical protein